MARIRGVGPDDGDRPHSARPALQLMVILLITLLPGLLAGCGGAEDNPGAGGSPESGRHPASGASGGGKDSSSPQEVGANEAGRVMVLEYHRVGGDPSFSPEWTISAEQFRRELTYLYDNGYYPVNFRDLVRGELDVPAGKTPVVLTFDDSSDTQFTLVRKDGEWVPDPGGAVGVLAGFHRGHPGWPMRGTFFVLPEANPPNHLFGQPELAGKKLRYLADKGFEVGSHTLYHANLALASPSGVREQLARSVEEIHGYLPDYEVSTLSVPFGEYPRDDSLLGSGSWRGLEYDFQGAAEVSGGASPAPYDTRFAPYHVPRIQTGDLAYQSRDLFAYFEQNPHERYVSDGDPGVVSFPEGSDKDLDKERIRASGKNIRSY